MNSKPIVRTNRFSWSSRALSLGLSASVAGTSLLSIPGDVRAKVIWTPAPENNLPSLESPPSTSPAKKPEQRPGQSQAPRPQQQPDWNLNIQQKPKDSADNIGTPQPNQDRKYFRPNSPDNSAPDKKDASNHREQMQADRAAPQENGPAKTQANTKPTDASQSEHNTVANRKRASELYDHGNQAYALAQYAKAIELFEEAWKLSHEPTMLHNLGQAYWKRYNVDPQLDYLRQAKTLFLNYDKMMRANPDIASSYNASEIEGYITAIQAQIHGVEQQLVADRRAEAAAKAAAAAAAAIKREGPTLRELQIRQRRRTTAAFKGTGIGLIVLGSASFLAMVAGLATRGGTKFMLDQANKGGDRGVNLNSPKDEKSQRRWYQTGGQIAFGALLSTAIALPIGVGLQITAVLRQRKDRREEQLRRKAKITYGPNPLEIHF